MGYYSLADEMFYGGAAGGGKTDLLLGLAGTAHRNAIVFRRTFPETRAMIERSREIYGSGNTSIERAKDPYNEQLHLWRLDHGGVRRLVEFGSCQYRRDLEKYRGRPHDFYGFDEITGFPEDFYHFLTAWLRTTIPGQRCRIVATGNPPTNAEGEWVIRYWAPWIDKKHPNPAKPGEIRWFVRQGDVDVEVDGPTPVQAENGELLYPRSRTFVPALLKDNPLLSATPAYISKLQQTPEPLRSQMLYGNFSIGVADHEWQVIPTQWLDLAMARWKPERPGPLDCLGVDVARGGRCKTVICPRHGTWFGRLVKIPGVKTPDGKSAAKYVIVSYQKPAQVNVDVVGYGSSCYDKLREWLGDVVHPVANGEGTAMRDKSGKWKLSNVRAASYWRLREALDPDSGKAQLAIMPDRELLADLCAPRYDIRGEGIILEKKEEIEDRIGRSPDCGDALVLSHWQSIIPGKIDDIFCWPPVPGSDDDMIPESPDDNHEDILNINGIEVDMRDPELWE